jgi:hypothetical protein
MTMTSQEQEVVRAAHALISGLTIDQGPRRSAKNVRRLTLAVCALDNIPHPHENDQQEWWRWLAQQAERNWRRLAGLHWRNRVLPIMRGTDDGA